MVRRLFGLLVPFLGSAAAIYTATLIFNREQFDYAVALAAPEDLAALEALGLDISLDATQRYWLGLGLVAVLFGLVNLLVKPVVRLVTFPIRILTFGLFSLVINAGLLFLVSFIARRPEIDLPFLVRLTPWVAAAAVYIGLAATIFNWLGDKLSGKGVKVVEKVKIVEVPAAAAPQVPQYQPRPAAQPVQRNYPPLSPAPRPAPAQPSYGPPPQPTTPSPYAPPQPGYGPPPQGGPYGPPPQPGSYGPPPQPGSYGPPPQPGTYGQPGQSTYGQPGQGSTYGSGNP